MLLTETIKKSTSAIKNRHAMLERNRHAEAYIKVLAQLSRAEDSLRAVLGRAAAMQEAGIVSTPLMDEATRADLLGCIDDCGSSFSDLSLSPKAVSLLQSKADLLSDRLKIVWKDAAQSYSEGVRGYLSIIGELSADPKRAKELAERIGKAVAGEPSTETVKKLVSDVAEAKKLTEAFSLNPEIEAFLKKVSAQQATVLDLTPNVLHWLEEQALTDKLHIRF